MARWGVSSLSHPSQEKTDSSPAVLRKSKATQKIIEGSVFFPFRSDFSITKPFPWKKGPPPFEMEGSAPLQAKVLESQTSTFEAVEFPLPSSQQLCSTPSDSDFLKTAVSGKPNLVFWHKNMPNGT